MPELIRLGVDATNPRDNLRSLESLASTGDNALRKLARIKIPTVVVVHLASFALSAAGIVATLRIAFGGQP